MPIEQGAQRLIQRWVWWEATGSVIPVIKYDRKNERLLPF